MSSRNLEKLTFLFWLVTIPPGAAAGFGPGEAAARSQPISARERSAAGNADFRVLFWYRRADPLATFQYQVYDLRKGEYTPAVDTWIKDVEMKYPAYTAFMRNVNLAVEEGKTEKLKVGAVIKRELTVAAALSGVILGSPINSSARPFESLQGLGSPTTRRSSPISNDRSFLNPGPTPFPVPVPYPRPHP